MMPRGFLKLDWMLITPVLVLILLSLTTLFSINGSFFRNQLLFFALSAVAFFLLSQINYRTLQFYALPVYFVSVFLLLLVLLLGFQSRGAVRWFDFLGFQIQFSEILKPFLALAFASFLAAQAKSFKTVALSLLFVLPIVVLIYKQPDLGNTLIYLMTVIATLFFYGFPISWFLTALGVFLITIPVSWKIMHQYQRQRILTFLHLANDPLGTSYNSIQAIIAIGSGLFFGKGLGQGTQSGLRFLPERHTDFIFATASEELGFIGATIIITAFAFLLYRLLIIFNNTDDIFCKLFIACAFSLLALQFFINIGMNLGILPIVGVALPFMSYGGSSLLSNAILLGFVASMSSFSSKKKVLEIK